jgi:small ligand-binding sensory domain FIST
MPVAVSLKLESANPAELVAALRRGTEALGGTTSGGLLFLSGTWVRQIVEVAATVRDHVPTGTILVTTGAGTLTQQGEVEHGTGAVGLLWRSGTTRGFVLDAEGDGPAAQRVARAIHDTMRGARGGVALFASRDVSRPTELFDERACPISVPVFGGGSLGCPGAVVVSQGQVRTGDIGGLAVLDLARPIVRVSSACKLLGEALPVTAVDGALMLTIGGRSALELLRTQAVHTAGQRLVVVAVVLDPEQAPRRRVLLREIRGVHDGRGGLMVSDHIPVGSRVAFAVLDPRTSRDDLELALRDASRDVRGGVPLFAVYVDCAGRGSQLYGEPNVDVKAIRRRWPALPFAGMMSAFGLGPGAKGTAAHFYSGVFTLFCAPS